MSLAPQEVVFEMCNARQREIESCCVMVNMNLTEGRRIGEFLTLRSLPSLQQPRKRKQFNKLQIFEPQLRQQSEQAIQERFVNHSG